ncbi:unnamed protein product [Sphagnum balticum]
MATTIATMSTAAIGAAPKLQHLSTLSTHPQARVGHSIGSARGFHWNSQGGYGVRNGHKKALIVRSSVSTVEGTELDAISKFSEIVPDTVIFDDFERFPPTAATVSSSLLLGITSLPKAGYNGAIDSALAYGKCYLEKSSGARLSCFLSKALVNVGAELVRSVPGRVSTEVDARLGYDTQGIVDEVYELLRLYKELEVSQDRLLFKIPATWQGIEAARKLEAEDIQTHLTLVYSFAQAAAAAQAGVSVIQIFVGRIRDWARNHSGDKGVEAVLQRGEDPGIALATKAYNYIHKFGHKSKVMAAAVRNKQDVFSLLGLDYLVVPVKVLQSLKDTKTDLEDKYAFVRRLDPSASQFTQFSDDELVQWDQSTFVSSLGPLAEDLIGCGIESYSGNTLRLEEHFSKIWPPPNV